MFICFCYFLLKNNIYIYIKKRLKDEKKKLKFKRKLEGEMGKKNGIDVILKEIGGANQ